MLNITFWLCPSERRPLLFARRLCTARVGYPSEPANPLKLTASAPGKARCEDMKLNKLPSRLTTGKTSRFAALTADTPRIRGNAWQAIRRRILLRDAYTCQGCGLVRSDHEIDHRVPLHMGGKNDDENLQVLCRSVGEHEGCHARKTRTEAGNRAGYCE